MDYKLVITERAEELLDKLVYYLLYNIRNEQAAIHLLDSVDKIYDRMEENPFQFPECRDIYLSHLGYREAVLADMKYLVIFKVEEATVYVLGVFHELESFQDKL
jgi:plasmid stabilization system protein ParE